MEKDLEMQPRSWLQRLEQEDKVWYPLMLRLPPPTLSKAPEWACLTPSRPKFPLCRCRGSGSNPPCIPLLLSQPPHCCVPSKTASACLLMSSSSSCCCSSRSKDRHPFSPPSPLMCYRSTAERTAAQAVAEPAGQLLRSLTLLVLLLLTLLEVLVPPLLVLLLVLVLPLLVLGLLEPLCQHSLYPPSLAPGLVRVEVSRAAEALPPLLTRYHRRHETSSLTLAISHQRALLAALLQQAAKCGSRQRRTALLVWNNRHSSSSSSSSRTCNNRSSFLLGKA
mmetsp:Transcript_16469/g.45140  ORF Transcript_16469/g.45140 Transcript_16469/m.45140 type:complete len:279 (-) Transcript_16469:376-1212(-)